MSDKVTIDHKEFIRLHLEVTQLRDLLKRAKTTIDHARNWRTNSDPDFQDAGMYRKVSEEIAQKLDA